MSAITRKSIDPAMQKGAVEGDRPDDEQHGNANAGALTPEGLPADPIATAEDRLGANVDDKEVAHASETGQSTEAPREEEEPLE